MNRFQHKISKLSTNKFILKYLRKTSSDIKISETRSIIRKNKLDNSSTYHVQFDYVMTKKPGLFSSYPSIAKKTIEDNISFLFYEDAAKYIEAVQFPSYLEFKTERYDFYNIVLKSDYFCADIDVRNVVSCKIYHYSDSYSFVAEHNHKHQTWSDYSFSSLISKIIADNRHIIVSSTNIVKSVEVNNIANISKSDFDKIRANIAETQDECDAILADELERTENYRNLLLKMLNKHLK